MNCSAAVVSEKEKAFMYHTQLGYSDYRVLPPALIFENVPKCKNHSLWEASVQNRNEESLRRKQSRKGRLSLELSNQRY